MDASQNDAKSARKRRGKYSLTVVAGTVITLLVLGVIVGLGAFVAIWGKLDVPAETEVAAAQTSIVYWNDGRTELARLGDTNRIPVSLAKVPEKTQLAVLAAEDRSFYEHGGVAVGGVLRAAWANLTTGSAQGGSTITQQYAKNAYLSSEKTYKRKFRELLLSLKLESRLSKEEILERYLNTIYFGRGAYGIQTAAEVYFGVPAEDLSLEQSAALAAIINAPGRFSPDRDRARLKQRYAYVLDGMVSQSWLTEKRRDKALKHFPKFIERRESQRFAGPNGHLIAAAQREALDRGFTEEDLEAGGLRIVTTFDQKAQQAAIDAVRQAGPTTGTQGLRIGLASVRPGTGEVVAIYGGADYLRNSLNNATQAIAQAGSTFKPFALAAAVESGIGLQSQWPGNSPHTVRNYTFQNYANNSYGASVSLLAGTENSINSAYVELEDKIGVAAVRDMALRAGIPKSTTGWAQTDDLTFVLGTASPHTLDIASAYSTFAARGIRTTPTYLRKIRAADGHILYAAKDTAKRTIDPQTADVVNYALQSVARNGTGRPALALGRPVAVKTGSTDEYLSAWFAGYTPQLATAVSFSKDDSKGNPVSLSGTGGMPAFYGSGYPARVWTAYMSRALQGEPVEAFEPVQVMPNGPGVLPAPAPTPVASQPPTATSAGSDAPSSPEGAAAQGGAANAEPTDQPGAKKGPRGQAAEAAKRQVAKGPKADKGTKKDNPAGQAADTPAG